MYFISRGNRVSQNEVNVSREMLESIVASQLRRIWILETKLSSRKSSQVRRFTVSLETISLFNGDDFCDSVETIFIAHFLTTRGDANFASDETVLSFSA